MLRFVLLFALLLLGRLGAGQLPPANDFFPDSPFPAIHGGNYRQASTPLPGPRTNQLALSFVPTPDDMAVAWLFYSNKYPNGERVLWAKTGKTVFKLGHHPDGRLRVIASYQTQARRKLLGLNLNYICWRNGEVWVKDGNEFTVLADQNPRDPNSPIVLKRKITAQTPVVVQHLGVLYDGNIFFNTRENKVGVLDRTGKLLDLLEFEVARGDLTFHNEVAIDARNNVYMVTNHAMYSFGWDGRHLRLRWHAPYDMGGNRLQGSGTTPTLMGVAPSDDKLVLVCDSHTPANMVAFWCDAPPADWRGLPGQSRQLAGVCALPGAQPPRAINAAIENSPVCWGYGIAAAQYNGFFGQPCNTRKGVYKCVWNPQTRRLELAWARSDINLNSVLTYSAAANLAYGSGREADCNYYYYGLDWATGRTVWKLRLGGEGKTFDDPGCANVIGEDGSITFPTRNSVVQLRPK